MDVSFLTALVFGLLKFFENVTSRRSNTYLGKVIVID